MSSNIKARLESQTKKEITSEQLETALIECEKRHEEYLNGIKEKAQKDLDRVGSVVAKNLTTENLEKEKYNQRQKVAELNRQKILEEKRERCSSHVQHAKQIASMKRV